MPALFRYSLSISLALVVSAVLLLAMSKLIVTEKGIADRIEELFTIEFVQLERNEQDETKQRIKPVERPEQTESLPPLDSLSFEAEQIKPQVNRLSVDEGVSTNIALTPIAVKGVQPQLGEVDLSANDRDAIVVSRIPPQYPRSAKRRKVEGWVKVAFSVDAEGKVSEVDVIDSQPDRVFDRAAITAIRQWRFKAKIEDGVPVDSRYSQTIEFNLTN